MTKTITTAEELATQPEGTIVRAHWLDGSQPDHFVVRIGEGGGAATGQFTLASTRQWLALANWGAELTVFSRPFQPTEPARCAPSREEIAEALHADTCAEDPDEGEACGCDAHYVYRQADIIQALCANQPTVAEVKAEAWQAYNLYDPASFAPTQPTPVFEAMGLPTPEVPSVGGEQR